MEADELLVGGTAGGSHEGFSRFHPLLEFLGLMYRCQIRPLCHFQNMGEARLDQSGSNLGERFGKLPLYGGGDHGHDLSGALHLFQDIDYLTSLVNGAEGTARHAGAAADTLLKINIDDPLFVLVNGADGADLFTGNPEAGYGVIGTGLDAESALPALVLIDNGFGVLNPDGTEFTGGNTRLGHTALTHVADVNMAGPTPLTCRIDSGQNLSIDICPVHGIHGIVIQESDLIVVGHGVAQTGNNSLPYGGPLLVDTAAVVGLAVLGTHFKGDTVDSLGKII